MTIQEKIEKYEEKARQSLAKAKNAIKEKDVNHHHEMSLKWYEKAESLRVQNNVYRKLQAITNRESPPKLGKRSLVKLNPNL